MNLRNISPIKMLFLGAMDGLLIGIVLEGIRLIYARAQVTGELADTAVHGKNIGYILEPTTNAFIPLLFMIVCAGASQLVSRQFVSRPRRLLLLWMILVTLSIVGAYYMAPIGSATDWSVVWMLTFVVLNYLVYYSWRLQPKSPPFFWPVVGITAIVVILMLTQTIGLFECKGLN